MPFFIFITKHFNSNSQAPLQSTISRLHHYMCRTIFGAKLSHRPTNFTRMKRASTLLLCCLWAVLSFSQQIEWAEGFGQIKRYVNEVALTSNGDIVALGDGMFVLNGQHELLFTKDEISTYVDDFYQGAYQMPDGLTHVPSAAVVCDFPTAGGAYLVFDENWDTQGGGDAYFFAPIMENSGKLLPFSNGDFFRIKGYEEGAARVNSSGNPVWSTDGVVNDIAMLVGENVLVAKNNGTYLFAPDGSPIEGNSGLIFTHLKTNSIGTVAARHEDTIGILLPTLVLAQAPLQIPNLIDFTITDEYLAVLSGTPAGIYQVEIYDLDQNLLHIFTPNNPSLYFETIALKNDEIILGGRDAYTDGYAAIVKSYTLDGITENYGADAGVTGFEVGNTEYRFGSDDTLICNDISITIQNFGNDILNNSWVNIDLTGWVNLGAGPCPVYDRYFTHFYENLDLSPGQSITLEFPEIVAVYRYDTLPAQQDLCFWTYTPNHRIDVNHDNDATCQSITTSVKEPDWVRSLSLFSRTRLRMF